MNSLPEIRMPNVNYGMAVFKGPWYRKFSAKDIAQFVIVRQGGCWFECPEFMPGSIFVPEGGIIGTVGGAVQIWRDTQTTPVGDQTSSFDPIPLEKFEESRAQGCDTKLLIGTGARSSNILLPAFPTVFYISPMETETVTRLNAMLSLIEMEAHGGDDLIERDGVVQRAAEIMTIFLARFVKQQLSKQNPRWPEMATDVHVMRALNMIETEPEKRWTVESLASEVGMGRSAFAVRFREMVGDTPVNCLTRARMRIASGAIRDGKRSIAAIAESIGYQSEPAFIKAYARHFGLTPGRYRDMITGRSKRKSGNDSSKH